MKTAQTCKKKVRLLTFLLCVATMMGLVACSTDGGRESSSGTSFASVSVMETANVETSGEMDDFTVTETDGGANVMTKDHFSYTAKNYLSREDGTFTVNQNFEVTFPDGATGAEFNRVNFKYRATAPMKVYIYYTVDGSPTEDYFFIEASKEDFSGLITAYLDGKTGVGLQKVVFHTCEKTDAQLTIYEIGTEVIPLYSDDLFIENDRFKFGVRLSWGGAITYYEDKNDGIADLGNLVNIHDTGRLIQQSFYGTYSNGEYVSGTQSSGAIWPYNPVQGGDKKNNGSRRLINVEVGEDFIYILSQALDWGFDNNISFCYYENRYTLREDHVLVDNVATDFSGWEHIAGGQEIPAMYVLSYFDTLCFYNGTKPWTGDKDALVYVSDLGGWSQSGTYFFAKDNTETWATWINTEDQFGFGIYCPNVDKLIAIRHQYNGSKNPMANATTYVAPSNSIVMQAYKPIVYSYLLTSGDPENIRNIFTANKDFTDNASLNNGRNHQRITLKKFDMTALDFTREETVEIFCGIRHAKASFDSAEQAARLDILNGQDPYVTLDFTVNADRPLSADDYNTVEIEYMLPADNRCAGYTAVLFLCSGDVKKPTEGYTVHSALIKDGQYHTLTLYLPDSKWSGDIHKIRFDFFHAAEKGDVMFVKSIRLVNKAEIKAENDLTKKGSEDIFLSVKQTDVAYDEAEKAVKVQVVEPNDVNVELIFSNLGIVAENYTTLEIEYMIPKTNAKTAYSAGFYLCAGEDSGYGADRVVPQKYVVDGEYHTMTVTLEGANGWSGLIKKIRFDYFESAAEAGDVIYIRSIALK